MIRDFLSLAAAKYLPVPDNTVWMCLLQILWKLTSPPPTPRLVALTALDANINGGGEANIM